MSNWQLSFLAGSSRDYMKQIFRRNYTQNKKAYLDFKCLKERHTVVQVHLSKANEEHSVAQGISHFIHQATTCKEGKPDFIPSPLSSAGNHPLLCRTQLRASHPTPFLACRMFLLLFEKQMGGRFHQVPVIYSERTLIVMIICSVSQCLCLLQNAFMMESIHKEGENKSLFADFSVRKMYYYVSKQENQ